MWDEGGEGMGEPSYEEKASEEPARGMWDSRSRSSPTSAASEASSGGDWDWDSDWSWVEGGSVTMWLLLSNAELEAEAAAPPNDLNT
jgi:hypothetical protein